MLGSKQWGWIGAASRNLTGSGPAGRGSLFFAKGMFWGWAAAGLSSSTQAGNVELTEHCQAHVPVSRVEMSTSDKCPPPVSQGTGGMWRPQHYGCVPTGFLEEGLEVRYRQCDFCYLHGYKAQCCCCCFNVHPSCSLCSFTRAWGGWLDLFYNLTHQGQWKGASPSMTTEMPPALCPQSNPGRPKTRLLLNQWGEINTLGSGESFHHLRCWLQRNPSPAMPCLSLLAADRCQLTVLEQAETSERINLDEANSLLRA